MSYKVSFSKGASKQLKKLSPELQEPIQARIDDLTIEPRPDGVKKLKGRENGYQFRHRKSNTPRSLTVKVFWS